jgi:hypothetical protein
MDNIIIIILILIILFFLYSYKKNDINKIIYYGDNKFPKPKPEEPIPPPDDLIMRSNFVKPNNKLHHIFNELSKEISSKNKITLKLKGIERMYTKMTIDEDLLYFIKLLIKNVIQKTKKIRYNIDYFFKDIIEVYQQVDKHGNQRYIIKCFIYDIKNYYEIKILIDILILNNDIYLNYIGEDISSNGNILNKYDYTMSNTGYLENRNHIQHNIKQTVDGYYRKYYDIIGYDSPPLEYSHYISKLDTVYKFNIGDLSKYYLPPDIPDLYSVEFGDNHTNEWDEHGIKQPTGNDYLVNNNSTQRQPNIPLDSPGSDPHTRAYGGEYDFLQQVGYNSGGNVVSSSWYY